MTTLDVLEVFQWHLDWSQGKRELPPGPDLLKQAAHAAIPALREHVARTVRKKLLELND